MRKLERNEDDKSIQKLSFLNEKEDKSTEILKKIEFIFLSYLQTAFSSLESTINYKLNELTSENCRFSLQQHLDFIKREGDFFYNY